MKKILISARDLKIGGIEKSLITLLNYLVEHGYIVTLVLEKKEGELLKELNSNIKVFEYMPCSIKFVTIRKTINFFKRIWFKIKYFKKFDVSISYATYSKVGSYIARCSSKNSILWCHADYLALYNSDKENVKKFFEEIYFNKFSKIVFVAKCARESFLQVFPNYSRAYFCNNLIDTNQIILKSEEKINIKYNDKLITFLNVCRHDERQKKLTRIIEAAKLLEKEKYNFRILFVGGGKDTDNYKKMVDKYNLENIVFFVGQKENPYPYYKISDCVILSSDYEGYPIVFLESYVLHKPVITTKVSDYSDIEKRGIVTEKNIDGIYRAMKKYMDYGCKIEEKFDDIKYNNEIKHKLNEILEKF